MARVKPRDVKDILNTKLEDSVLLPYIATAHTLLDNACSGLDYPEDLLTQIEKWLAAHFVCVRSPRIKSEGGVEYEGKSGSGLEASTYGQQALALDYKGGLRNASDSGRIAGMKAF